MTEVTKVDSMMTGTSGGGPTPTAPPPSVASDTMAAYLALAQTDLSAVSAHLVPIQEDLNDAAEDAMFPSPPINTPVFSPAPSVASRALSKAGRGRGFSVVNDRLDRLAAHNIEKRGFTDRDSVGSDDGVETQSIHIKLGSPNKNPRIEEYMSFPLNPDDYRDENMTDNDDSASKYEYHNKSGVGSVNEQSNWEEDTMFTLECALMRLEQLAKDEARVKGGEVMDLYMDRLNAALKNTTKYPVTVKKASSLDHGKHH